MQRGINDFNRGYQPRTNIVNDQKSDLVADSHSILARWRNHFSQLLNVHGVNDVRQTEIHMTEPLVPEPSAFEVELAVEKVKSHRSPGIDQIPAELIKTGGKEVKQFTVKPINLVYLFEIRRNCLRSRIYTKGDKTDCSNYSCISLLL